MKQGIVARSRVLKILVNWVLAVRSVVLRRAGLFVSITNTIDFFYLLPGTRRDLLER